jgi:methionine sulfoxide reductase heme-binding subunit
MSTTDTRVKAGAAGAPDLTHLVRIATHIGALAPLAWLAYRAFANMLTVNPVQAVVQNTGLTGIRLLMLSLACTPLFTLFRFRPALAVRRALGLYGYMYIALHFTAFAVLDFGLDLGLIWLEISEKPYIIVGVLGLLILTPLAITSTKGWQKRLGKSWKTLHRAFYGAMALGVLHFWWSQKADLNEALFLYAPILVLLLLARVPAVKRWAARR